MLRTAPSLVLMTGLLLACGGKSFSHGGDAEGESGSGGSSTEGGTGSAGAPSGGKASGGSAGAPQCDPSGLEDETSNGVGLRLINGTKHAIYLGSEMPGCNVALVQVTRASGEPLSEVGFCAGTCEQLLSGNVSGCPPIPCPASSVLTLQPGESSVMVWRALYSEEVSVPPACQSKSVGTACERIARAKPGVYVFSAQAGSALECTSPEAMSCQLCEPSGDGGCRTYPATIAGRILHAQTKIEVDASYGLGEPSADAAARQVEITFTDQQ